MGLTLTKKQESRLAEYIRQCEQSRDDAFFFNKQLEICQNEPDCKDERSSFAALALALFVGGFYIGSEVKK